MRGLFFSFLAFLLILSIGFSSATVYVAEGYTYVKGRVIDVDTANPVGGANVTVVCNHEGVDYMKTQESFEGPGQIFVGTYGVVFNDSQCVEGDLVTVSAVKDGKTGMRSGIVNSTIIEHFDIAVINVPLVPEFGFVIGMLTIFGALGVFFVVRD